MSRNILKIIAGNDSLIVDGFSWQKEGTSLETSPSSLTAKILCQNHNSELSTLDSEAGNFFLSLRYDGKSSTVNFDGETLERWLLKVLIGVWLGERRDAKVPKSLLDILFGERVFSAGLGLYAPVAGRKLRGVYNGFELQLAYADRLLTEPAGVFLQLGWMALYLMIIEGIGPNDLIMSYRPSEISVAYPDSKKIARFPWRGLQAGFSGKIPDHP